MFPLETKTYLDGSCRNGCNSERYAQGLSDGLKMNKKEAKKKAEELYKQSDTVTGNLPCAPLCKRFELITYANGLWDSSKTEIA